MRGKFVVAAFTASLLIGCVETPRHPVMRPIPPPPPFVPVDTGMVQMPNTPSPVASGTTNQGSFVVSSNFVANSAATNMGDASNASIPQYEIIPPQPSLDHVWRNGYWRWEGAWAWVPGEWLYQPPRVIYVPEPPMFYHHYHFGYGPWRHGHRRHRHW